MSGSEPASRPATRSLSERGAVALAGVVALAAWWSPAVPWWVVALALAVAAVWRRPVVLVVALGLLAAALGARAWQGAHPAAPGPIDTTATLVGDPQLVSGAVVAEVRAAGHHYEAWARGRAGAVLNQRAAGQSVRLTGHVVARPAGDDLEARRHVIGSISVTDAVAGDDGGPVARLANAARGVVLAGGEPLAPSRRALYGGFVLGDERGQTEVLAADFRGSGLSHLLVVSGENVAFVLAAASPLLKRLGARSRWMATIGVLVLFALMTRFEPSVLRATAMAMIAISAWSLGRAASTVRVLALAVTAVLLIDPMLVGVAGFQLSVAAAAGIVVMARPLAAHLPLPALVARPLAVTMAAQVTVAPILIALYGGVPVATIPANLLAEPAAAILMAWGLTVGVVAGLVGGSVAAILQAPADWLTWWVETVARWAAAAPLGQLSSLGLGLAVTAGLVAVLCARRGRMGWARMGWIALVAVLAGPAVALSTAVPARQAALGDAATLWSSPGRTAPRAEVLVLSARARVRPVLDGLRSRGVNRIALLVAASGGTTTAALVAAIGERIRIDRVWGPAPPPARSEAPPSAPIGETPAVGAVAEVGQLSVEVTSVRPHLVVRVSTGPWPPRPAAMAGTRPVATRSRPPVGPDGCPV